MTVYLREGGKENGLGWGGAVRQREREHCFTSVRKKKQKTKENKNKKRFPLVEERYRVEEAGGKKTTFLCTLNFF